jgi:hypothetical protein
VAVATTRLTESNSRVPHPLLHHFKFESAAPEVSDRGQNHGHRKYRRQPPRAQPSRWSRTHSRLPHGSHTFLGMPFMHYGRVTVWCLGIGLGRCMSVEVGSAGLLFEFIMRCQTHLKGSPPPSPHQHGGHSPWPPHTFACARYGVAQLCCRQRDGGPGLGHRPPHRHGQAS